MQHPRVQTHLARFFLLAALSFTVLMQTAMAMGGDKYQIFLNKKLVLTQYVGDLSSGIMALELDQSNYNDQLVIIYSHCGVTGKGRNIVVKNEQNKILKEWKFADASGEDVSMSIPVKDILELKKHHGGSNLTLHYSAAELLPKGLMLASFKAAGKSVTYQSPKGLLRK
ncbi:MAG: hypothetical protein WKF89_18940 [Chitinophagaceae bacterium]